MSSTNPTPNQVYVSNSVPFGGFFATLYRNSTTPVVLDSKASAGKTFYRIESCSLSPKGDLKERPDVDGGDNGWTLVNGPIEGSITIQLPNDGSPTPANGDFFKTSVLFRDATGAAIAQIVVITNVSITADQNYRKITGSVRVDQFPGTAVAGIAEYSGS